MKKILFSLVALVASMSMNAQVMKVIKDGVEVAKYKGANYTVVFEEAPALEKTGTAKRTGDIDVNWVQLWEDGPRFAEYNVGAESASEYGGHYAWGGFTDNSKSDVNTSRTDLTGDTDTATKLWGSNWRMPTKDEYDALVANCTKEWKTVNGMQGYMITGQGDYSSNSVFFPAAGEIMVRPPMPNRWESKDEFGKYWSSTPASDYSYVFTFNSSWQYLVTNTNPAQIFSVRAVLTE